MLIGIRGWRQSEAVRLAAAPTAARQAEPSGDLPRLRGESAEEPLLNVAFPDENHDEATRIAQRMEALVAAAEPVLSEAFMDASTAPVVTPEEGLRKMAESVGLPDGARVTEPRSRTDFMNDSAPAVPPGP